ncbi:MAG: YybH family protein [Nitrososphaerota archaeon]|jgi:ketosteroid isomerase-like protein
MSGKMTPEEVLGAVTEGINNGDLDSLMKLYEPGACFASQPGMLAKGPEGIGECLGSFIDKNGKLDLTVKRILKTKDIALVTTEWSFNGTDRDGKHVHISAKSADVLRQQPDGTWLFVIDNPWGTD